MRLEELNPWWITGQIGEDFRTLAVRDIFAEISPYLDDRQILVLSGLRRTGKTVMMHQLIQHLLQNVPPNRICYYNFDLGEETIEGLLRRYEELTAVNYKQEKVFFFLDEVQKHPSWENEVKVLYDFQKVKFVISGSSSLFIEKRSKESLAGRTFSFQLSPLTFKEYLRLRGQAFPPDKIALFQDEAKMALRHYARTGGFPELLSVTEEFKINKYIKELVLDRIIYIDIPKVFDIEEPELLVKLLAIVSANPGMITDYESLADDLQRHRRTISNYLFYLEKSFLIKKLYNYSKNLLTTERKSKRIYPSSTAFAYLYGAEKGRILETMVLMNKDLSFFSRRGNKEVDFISTENNGCLPLEVKSVLRGKKEMKGILSFGKQEGVNKGVVLTEEGEGEEEIDEMTIRIIPLWKWLLRSE